MSASPLSWRSSPAITRTRTLKVASIGLALLAALALAMYVYDHSRRDMIADGVRVDGVPVGGLSESAALAKVQHDLSTRLSQPVVIRSGSHTWTLSPHAAALAIDAHGMVAQALSASREGSIFSRTARSLFGGAVKRDIPLAVSFSYAAVRAAAARVRTALDRPPRNATVLPSATSLTTVPARDGVSVDEHRLTVRIEAALMGGGAGHPVAVPITRTKPRISTRQLAAEYPAYIIVDREDFRLRFFEHLKLADTYEIAVGMEGLETPAGLHKIEWKEEDPSWFVPDKAWAGALAGTVVPPGPEDPLKARFMSFDGGAGIHGIDPSEYETIGHDASHGCVRMRIPEVIALYSKTPLGTPVYIT